MVDHFGRVQLFNRKNDDENRCGYCKRLNRELALCEAHKPCKICLTKEDYPPEIDKCMKCLDLIKNYCKFCFKEKNYENHIRNPSHLLHSYCMKCFTDKESHKERNECSKCLVFYCDISSSSGYGTVLRSKRCMFCKLIPSSETEVLCNRHIMCYQCISLILADPRYLQVLECSECRYCINKKCLESIENRCRICFKNVPNTEGRSLLTCSSNHICCITCFKSRDIKYEKISCTDCAEFYQKAKKTNCCYFCKKEKQGKLAVDCKDHYLCYTCKQSITEFNFEYYLQCDCYHCGVVIRNLFVSVSSTPSYSNRSINSSITNRYGQIDSSIYECIGCPFVRKSITDCEKHRFCEICFKFRMDTLRIGNCLKCRNLKEDGCRNCYTIITYPNYKIYNPMCEKYKHFYCEACFTNNKIRYSTTFCNDCKLLYNTSHDTFTNCILCTNPLFEPSYHICGLHRLCWRCKNLVSSENIKAYTEIINCSECKQHGYAYLSIPSKWTGSTSSISTNSLVGQLSITENPAQVLYIPSKYVTPSTNPISNATTDNYPQLENLNSINSSNPNLIQPNNTSQFNYPNLPAHQFPDTNTYNNPQPYHANMQTDFNSTGYQFFNPQVPNGIQYFTADAEVAITSLSGPADVQQIDYQNYAQSHNIVSQGNVAINPALVCCDFQREPMECNHPKCPECITSKFYVTYQKFIQECLNKNLKWLNEQKHGIGCSHVRDCFNRLCIPFEEVNSVALLVLKERGLDEGLADYFSLVFEEIPAKFSICRKCGCVKICFTVDYCYFCRS